ncbi:basement membrane-specific heparan sulfate proteoglycan core protein-like [Pollicipes pollicipes]|uniref:basement membrane-specific heparan sulfate proteoglycan core protein-like n=1 Tax=Pollicipes pollicipes TaxID=41117 RepID=UPI0018857F3B|nr:basement membrane-specific heparan sulfate proteoglycan core protein-like [Pollicipes pollicipes]
MVTARRRCRSATSADGSVASFSSFRVDSAQRADTTQGPATLVEECRCPPGYTGMSCEECAPGYERRPGDFLGTCVEEAEECRPGEYGDPRRGIACRPCPCPGPRFQFGSTCFLDTDDQVTCNCEPGYAGRRCERCAPGYRGQPGRGQPCVRGGECDPAGSLRDDPDPRTGLCDCKEFVTGSRCDRCVPRAFHLSASNQHGCVNCFCMGVTDQCSSSDWYRQQESLVFSTDGLDVRDTITDYEMDQVLTQGTIDSANQQLVFTYYEGLGDDNPLYWNLPAQFLGDQVTAYGGSLRFSQSYAANVAAESFSSYPDVEIMGNDVRLQHILEVDVLPNQPWTLEVPMLEQAWQRHDGVRVDREHLMMALADLEYIIIKAAHFRGASRSTLSNVQLDVASPRATGQARAHAVEKCSCPVGYKGLSCEDCDVGFTRSLSGLYLRSCARCDCSGRSSECDPETGECLNCRENTSGPRCELCAVGYAGDPSRGRPCRPRAGRLVCSCDSRGSQTTECDSQGRCNCKENVEGDQCDRCRPGYFGLGTDPVTGCTSCFCSGVSRECSSAPFYQSHLPMQVYDEHHGFVLVTRDREGSTSDATETIEFNAGDNEVSFQEGPTGSGVKYWMLPDLFTGEQMSSYGGLLTMRQRISPDAECRPRSPTQSQTSSSLEMGSKFIGGTPHDPRRTTAGSRTRCGCRRGTHGPTARARRRRVTS